jgi:hypothetical protein
LNFVAHEIETRRLRIDEMLRAIEFIPKPDVDG